MPITTLSSREFQQNANRAQKAARRGPVVITNRGRPVQVLLSYDDYVRMAGEGRSLVDSLAMSGLSGIRLTFPRRPAAARPADLS